MSVWVVALRRVLTQVESTQAMIRIVGLSATLPNYRDVARFLRASPERGLFYFSGAYRSAHREGQAVSQSEVECIRQMSRYGELFTTCSLADRALITSESISMVRCCA